MDKILWDNVIMRPIILVTKLNNNEYKLKISNKHHNAYETIINNYYFTDDLFDLNNLEDILINGVTNQIVDNIKYQTIIYEIDEKINVKLSISITSKLLKEKSSEFNFTLDKITIDNVQKHKFIVEDVMKEIYYPIVNFETIQCKLFKENTNNRFTFGESTCIICPDFTLSFSYGVISTEFKNFMDNWLTKHIITKGNFHNFKYKYGNPYQTVLMNIILKFIKSKKYKFIISISPHYNIFKQDNIFDDKKIRLINDLNIPYLKGKTFKILSHECNIYNDLFVIEII